MPITPPGNSSSSDDSALAQAVDLGDAVADLDDGPDGACLHAGVELVDRRLDEWS